MAKTLLLPRSTLASGPCSLCRCEGSGHLAWTNFNENAGWRDVIWTAEAWRAWPLRSPSPLFQLPNFTPHLIAFDWMHVKYLGHDQFTYGSVLSLLTKYVLTDEPHANLAKVWRDILSYYDTHAVPCRYRYLNKTSMYERVFPKYPKLRGKAAEVKYLAGPIYFVWHKYHSPHLRVHRQILLYLKLNLEIEEALILHKDEVALPREEAIEFKHKISTMLLLLTGIAEHFLEERLFNLTQKAHFLQHISLLTEFLNPRLAWCFQGEDMQRRMACLAKSSVNGLQPGQTIGKMFRRYRLALHLTLQDND